MKILSDAPIIKGILHASFSKNGESLVTALENCNVELWDLTGTYSEPVARLEGHSGWVRQAQFTPDGKRIVSASDDKFAFSPDNT